MIRYKMLAAAFSYPDEAFFQRFPEAVEEKDSIVREYDRLFRAGIVWLYGAEHLAENEFQRANLFSDIMGFYLAFGVEPDKERPDSLSCEMEFLHYLIYKRVQALKGPGEDESSEKARICSDAERKFFVEHLAPAAQKIAEGIVSLSDLCFYKEAARNLLGFLESEREHFGICIAEAGSSSAEPQDQAIADTEGQQE
jgi:TorA maturation chaperone TorD